MKSLLRIVVFFAVCMSFPCFGQESYLPAKPEPQGQVTGFAESDREFWIEAGAVGAAWTADAVSTHELFAAHANAYEGGGLFNGSRSTPKVMAAWAGVDVGMGFAAYEWKNHVHNRYLHPFWRAFLAAPILWHVQAAGHNFAFTPRNR